MSLRKVPIHRVGIRENLFMGGERNWVMFTGLIAFTLIFAFHDMRAFVFGIALWFGALYLLRLMAKNDPKMTQVFFKSRKYKSYYPAHSTPFRINSAGQGKRYK